MRTRTLFLPTAAAVALTAFLLLSQAPRSSADGGGGRCQNLPNEAQLRQLLNQSVSTGGDAGGLFHGTRMWGALVNRGGDLCASITSTIDPTQVWPGSQAIAKAKAYTANAFSLDTLALSTARLYTFTQPGHSLNSLGQSNPFNPQALAAPGG